MSINRSYFQHSLPGTQLNQNCFSYRPIVALADATRSMQSFNQRLDGSGGARYADVRSLSSRSSSTSSEVEILLNQPQKRFVRIKDDKVIYGVKGDTIKKMLDTEELLLPNFDVIRKLQTEINMEHRRNAIKCLEQPCFDHKREVIIPLAVNLLDRTLSTIFVPIKCLPALACACLLIAGKVKSPTPFCVKEILCYFTNSLMEEDVIEWEIRLTSVLKWKFLVPTAFEFLDQIIVRCGEIHKIQPSFFRICCKLQEGKISFFAFSTFSDENLASLRPSCQAVLCAGFAAHQSNSQNLYCSIELLGTALFGIPCQVFQEGVNRLAMLFLNRNLPTFEYHTNIFRVISIY
uniref:Cyclin N-terminal domain-containing protein n=1 Tax=Panagrolaimus sp. JU765 TaxID=591449 RepID=A0AC34RPC2_9BILA